MKETSEETIEKIFETACDLCHWPYVYRDEGTLQAEKCDYCPMETVLKEAAAEATSWKGNYAMTCDNYFCLSNRHGMCISIEKNPDCSGREIIKFAPNTAGDSEGKPSKSSN